MHLQTLALKQARAAVTEVSAAMALPNSEGWTQTLKARRVLQYLRRELDIEGLTQVPFLRECNMAVLTHALRQIKYRARIPVADAWTIMGILDETGTLKEGEIYVCIQQPQGQRCAVKGKCLVTRRYVERSWSTRTRLTSEQPHDVPGRHSVRHGDRRRARVLSAASARQRRRVLSEGHASASFDAWRW
jgi:hypothetical protein